MTKLVPGATKVIVEKVTVPVPLYLFPNGTYVNQTNQEAQPIDQPLPVDVLGQNGCMFFIYGYKKDLKLIQVVSESTVIVTEEPEVETTTKFVFTGVSRAGERNKSEISTVSQSIIEL